MDHGWEQVLLARLYEKNPEYSSHFLLLLRLHGDKLRSLSDNSHLSWQNKEDPLYMHIRNVMDEADSHNDIHSFVASAWREIYRQIDWYDNNKKHFNLYIIHRLLYDMALISDFALRNPIGNLNDPIPLMKEFYGNVYRYFKTTLPSLNLYEKEPLHYFLQAEFGQAIAKMKQQTKRKFPIIPIINNDGFVGIYNFVITILRDYFLVGYGHELSSVHAGAYKSFSEAIRHDYQHLNEQTLDESSHKKRGFYDACIFTLRKAKEDCLDYREKSRALRAIVFVFFMLHEIPMIRTADYKDHNLFGEIVRDHLTFGQIDLHEKELLDDTLLQDSLEIKEAMFRAADLMSLFEQFDPTFYEENFAIYDYKNDNGNLSWGAGMPTKKHIAEKGKIDFWFTEMVDRILDQ